MKFRKQFLKGYNYIKSLLVMQFFLYQETQKCSDLFFNDLLSYYELDSLSLSALTDLFKYHLHQVNINGCIVRVHVMTETRVQVTNELISTTKIQKLGKAVYLTASLFNHSCDPNLTLRFVYYTCITLLYAPICNAIITLCTTTG